MKWLLIAASLTRESIRKQADLVEVKLLRAYHHYRLNMQYPIGFILLIPNQATVLVCIMIKFHNRRCSHSLARWSILSDRKDTLSSKNHNTYLGRNSHDYQAR